MTIHENKDLAELNFVRPAGSRISVTIPLDQLREIYEDIGERYAAETPAAQQKK